MPKVNESDLVLTDDAVKFLEEHTKQSAQEIREQHTKFLKDYPDGRKVFVFYFYAERFNILTAIRLTKNRYYIIFYNSGLINL